MLTNWFAHNFRSYVVLWLYSEIRYTKYNILTIYVLYFFSLNIMGSILLYYAMKIDYQIDA